MLTNMSSPTKDDTSSRSSTGRGWLNHVALSLGLGCALSLFFLLVSYPGNLSPDSTTSWGEAFSGRISTIKPPLITLIQSLYSALPSPEFAVAAFTFTQGVLFWFSIFLFVSLFVRKTRTFVCVCLSISLIFPLWPYTTLNWVDVWVVIFFLFSATFFELFLRSDNTSARNAVLACVFLVLSASTRHNAVSILPIAVLPIAFILLHRWQLSRQQAYGVAALSLPFLFLATKIFLLFPQVVPSPSLASFGLLNQYLGAIASSEASTKTALIASEEPLFDDRFGPGSLRASVQAYEPGFNGYDLLWKKDAILKKDNSNGFQTVLLNADFITPAFWRVLIATPSGFAKHKADYLVGQFGSGSLQYPFDWGVFQNQFGVSSRPALESINGALPRFLREQTKLIFYHHWFMFLIGFAAFVANMRSLRDSALTSLFAFSVLYAIPFMFFETGWEWRYLMPCYIANILLTVCVTLRLTERRARMLT
jgi:hypothetical protein